MLLIGIISLALDAAVRGLQRSLTPWHLP